jgi:Mg/Co/Ni transporter MgtE
MSEDIKIHFVFDKSNIKKRLKWKDIKLIQKVKAKEIQTADVLDKFQILVCRFMVDENNQVMPLEQAFEIFDELSQEEAEDVITKFTEAMAETAIPKANEMESTSPLPAGMTTATLPDGLPL